MCSTQIPCGSELARERARSDADDFSTFDGLALAWSCAFELSQHIKAFTLFSTHYFELTHLALQLSNTQNIHLDAKEYEDNLIFLHAVEKGPANKSYGLQVAKLAGIPQAVLQRAAQTLEKLEQQQLTTKDAMKSAVPIKKTTQLDKLIKDIQQLNPDDCTPKDALQKLYQLTELYETLTSMAESLA